MLEILLLMSLCKKIGQRARDKGLSAGRYQFFVVLAWFGGELVGGAFMGIMCYVFFDDQAEDYMWFAYLAAIFTAAMAVWFVFKIVAIKPEIPYDDDDEFDSEDDESPHIRTPQNGNRGDDRITKK